MGNYLISYYKNNLISTVESTIRLNDVSEDHLKGYVAGLEKANYKKVYWQKIE